MKKKLEAPEWFFMWAKGQPYITMICGWNKKAVIWQCEKEHGITWKKIYDRGGRVVRCNVSIV
ncbi:MAG: hypothetical protein HY035_05315 [Nitrospirae bacterium]|nr:hypothetical protein [Nitrospirota bacterium]MBI3377807.1 hypothetical protein [Nitrospirota bacterium]